MGENPKKASLGWSLSRALVIAGNTFRQASRMKLYPTMLVAAVALLASSFLFRDFDFGSSELKFIADFGFGGMSVFGSLLAIVLTVQLFLGEIEHQTAITALAKPIYRSEFLIGKYLGAVGATAVFIFALDLCLMLALALREGAISSEDTKSLVNGVDYFGVFVFAIAQVLRASILCALAMLFSSYARSLIFAISVCLLAFLAGQLQPIAEAAAANADGGLHKAVLNVGSFLIPNLRIFDIGDAVALAGGGYVDELGYLTVYALIYVGAFLGIAVFSFSKREV